MLMLQLLNQLDGFEALGKVKMIMATNRPDVLDPALLRAGRLDRKIEIPLPNEVARNEILKIHATKINKIGDIGNLHAFFTRFLGRCEHNFRADYEAVVKLTDGFNGADLRNVCTEAGVIFFLVCTCVVSVVVMICEQQYEFGDTSGMFAIRQTRDFVIEEDFMKAARKIGKVKKMEGKLEYSKV